MRGVPVSSPLAKSVLGGTIAAAHLGLLAFMATPAQRLIEPDGGAPVVNLTLSPSPRIVSAPAKAAAAAAAPTPEKVAPERLKLREIVAPIAVETLAAAAAESEPAREIIVTGSRVTRGETRTAGPQDDGRIPASVGAASAGGAPAAGAAAAPEEDFYAARVIAWVEQHKGQPQRSLVGTTTVRFVLDRYGRLRDRAVLASSGDARVDALALDVLEAAQPYPRPPAGTAWRTREFRVRLDYRPRAR